MNPYLEEPTIKELWCDICWERTEHEWLVNRWVCCDFHKHDEICKNRFREHALSIAYDRGLRANTFGTDEELSVHGYAREWERGFRTRRTGVKI